KRDDARAVGVNESVPHDVNCVRLGLESIERGSNVLRAPDFKWRDLEAERPGFGLNLESLPGKIGRLDRQAGDVAAWPRETRDQAADDGIVRYCKDNGDNRCRLLYHRDGNSRCDNDVDLQADELRRDLGVALGTSFGPAILDCDGAIIDPTEFTQSLRKGSSVWTPGRSVRA